MMRSPDAALAASTSVYGLARYLDWSFPAYPSGGWYFSPFAWQFLFTMGAWAALGGGTRVHAQARSRAVLATSVAFVLFAFAVTLAARLDKTAFLPSGLLAYFVPNDKTNLAPYRMLQFLALAVIVVRLVPKNWAGLRSAMLRPVIVCGQRSLEVFCLGIFLSLVGHSFLKCTRRNWSSRLRSAVPA